MAIFQKAIYKKHSPHLNPQTIAQAYENFQKYYGDAQRLQNILELKEENYQEGFLREIFVQCLGYTLNPDKNFDLTTEYKNPKDNKKADGAILKNGQAIAVIELKSTQWVDLERIKTQAFGYKINQPHCKYVITSNFRKIRFYIDHAVDFEEFELFGMSEKEFRKMYLILHRDSLINDLPLQLREESKTHIIEITERLYRNYKHFRDTLFEDMQKGNRQYAQLLLFQKAQKLLDRFLFIFFAEDKGLIPPKVSLRSIEQWKQLKELNTFLPLYSRFQKIFRYLDEGYEYPKWGKIPAYNGELFKPDAVLDDEQFRISDGILENNINLFAMHDYDQEVDVNILGHIFEHSISEIEEMLQSLSSLAPKGGIKTQNKQQGFKISERRGLRKQEGVFYTPPYITEYMVAQTLGKLCSEKRQELEIENILMDASFRRKDGKLNAQGKKLLEKLKVYQHYLSNLKILDPACGSGAFLNEALNFLIQEHQKLNTEIAELLGKTYDPTADNTDKEALEQNIFGVDINMESVEIAKLSLWLKTARRGRALSFLSSNLKVGNSLIDDPKIAGNKAFDWHQEFPEIMQRGGFDVVIGNPPYFNIQTLGKHSIIAKFIQENYSEIWQDKSDILFYFIHKAIQLSKNQIGFIVSNAFLFSDKAQKLRNYLLENVDIQKVVNFEQFMVFKDASITTAMLMLDKNKTGQSTVAYSLKQKEYKVEEITRHLKDENNFIEVSFKENEVFALVPQNISDLNEKIDANYPKLKQLLKVGKGMETAANDVFEFSEYPQDFDSQFIKKRMSGEAIQKYTIKNTEAYLLYLEEVEKFEDLPLKVQMYLEKHQQRLKSRADKIRRKAAKWWNYTFAMHKDLYHLDKIWCAYRAKENIFCFDNTKKYIGLTNTTVIFDTNSQINLKYVLALLNSKALNFRYKSIGKQTGSGVYEYFENGIGKLPIPEISLSKQQVFIDKIQHLLRTYQALETHRTRFLKRIKANLSLQKITKNIEEFYLYDFASFNRELKKQHLKLSFQEQDLWEEYFDTIKIEIQKCLLLIQQTERELDQEIYKLYKLTKQEIERIEKGF